MIRVAFDGRIFKPSTRHWGPAVVARNLIEPLKIRFQFGGIAPSMPDAQDFHITRTWPKVRALDKALFEMSGYLAQQPDVYWGTNGFAPAFGLKCPILLTVHDALLWDQPGDQRGARFLTARAASSMRRAQRILSDSKTSADTLIRHFPELASKMEVALLGHQFSDRGAGKSSGNEALPQPPDHPERFDAPFLLMLGAHRSRKNLGFLLQVMKALHESGTKIPLVITGGIDASFAEAIQASPQIHCLGYRSSGELAWLMQRALCLAFPSTYEGFGLPLLEAMSQGCPVIASDLPIHREIGGDGAWTLPLKVETWVEAIRQLLATPTLREEFIAKGKAWSATFSWEKTARIYEQAFLALAR